MRKKARMLWFVPWVLLPSMALSGCAGIEYLNDIPRDFALALEADASEEISGEQPEAGAEAVLALSAIDRISFLMEEAYHFAGDSLSEAEQIWYRDMEQILGGYGTDVELSPEGLAAGLGEADMDKIFQCVMCDHPELFYVDGYSYTKYMRGEQITAITFSGTYNGDLESVVEREQEIRAAADGILAGIEAGADDYKKIKYVYEALISNTDYDIGVSDHQNIYSVFVHHLSVCQGYAKATQYLLNRLGVECTLVQGTVQTGEGHAWNLVKVDGEYYYVDTTWGDVSYRIEDGAAGAQGVADPGGEGAEAQGVADPGGEGAEAQNDAVPGSEGTEPQEGAASGAGDVNPQEGEKGIDTEEQEQASEAGRKYMTWEDMPEINYDYLNVTTQEILRTHTIGGVVPMPLCTAVEANYYRKEGALFSCYDEEQMAALFQKAIETGKRDVTVKCMDAVCYEEVYEALIAQRGIFDYLEDGKSTVAYAQNENQFSLTFWVTNE